VLDQGADSWLLRLENRGLTGEISQNDNNFKLRLRDTLNCIGILVDSYDISINSMLGWKECCRQLAIIDDFGDVPDFANFVISSSLDRHTSNKNHMQIIMQGPKYTLLSPEYYNCKQKKESSSIVNIILISFGLYDSQNCTKLAINALKETKFDGIVRVAIGSKAPHLSKIKQMLSNYSFEIEIYEDVDGLYELNSEADLVIGAGGVSLLERMALGKPSITFIVTDNQESQVKWATSIGATISFTLNEYLLKSDIVNTINILLSDMRIRNNMSKIAANIIDGKGALRASEVLMSNIKMKDD
jgi:spore coat polysaccharide biosynthesis predicted glycosyltransferase SpsG